MSAVAVLRIAGWATVATAGALLAPPVGSLDPTLRPTDEALVFGGMAGALLFVALAGPLPVSILRGAPRRRLVARSAVLALKSAQEEALWRGVALGVLIAPVGRLAALGASSALFAVAHAGRLGRRASTHLVTGLTFGVAYVVTGRLCAAMAAHCTYNVLVGAAALAREDMAVLATSRLPTPLVASTEALDRLRLMHEPAPTRAATVASLDAVSKAFGAVKALDRVDLELRRGEVVALLGPNGAGKSTAVAVLLGLRRPDTGVARLFGHDPIDPAARRSIGVVLQDVGFPPALRVRETMELVRAHFPEAVPSEEALAHMGLDEFALRDAGALSGGQRRRLAVALSLAGRPDALFLDEPTAGMDALGRRALLRDVAEFASEGGAVLLTTQQLADAEEIATRVVVLTQGRVLVEGTVAEVRARAGLTRVTVRATRLPPLGAGSVESRGDRHVVYVQDADAFVAGLVRSGVLFSELEVVPVSLEDAFVTLTGKADA
jgi:ABC-2 type transport system ATP-binding protein